MTPALIGLGSNLGDRPQNLDAAVAQLAKFEGVRIVAISRWHATQPVGGPPGQPEFLNGAALIETSLRPEELLAALQRVEVSLGRVRGERWGPRTLDLDLLLFGAYVIDSPQLVVPHPLMVLRQFVLESAAEIAPEMRHPTLDRTIRELGDQLRMQKGGDSGPTGITMKSQRPEVITHRDELRRTVRGWQAAGQRVGLVPTMGALHAGHLSLVARSIAECDRTVATIFVNPTQFGPNEDFTRYPRALDRDLELLAGTGTDVVFAPTTEEMYPEGQTAFVEFAGLEPLSRLWEGAIRPGHFRGVATVVLKLFQAAPADLAYFGQKDYQQSVVIRRMVADLDLLIEIRVCPIVREPDGLAMSSRNVYLSGDDRQSALVLSQSLRLAADSVRGGERDAAQVAGEMRKRIEATAGVTLDYAVLVDPETLEEVNRIDGRVVALVAARVGATRLIDNEIIESI